MIAMLALSGCAGPGGAEPTGQVGSGVFGVVVSGPACPVEVAGSPCPDRPIPAMVTARAVSGLARGDGASTDDGRFRIPLPPGRYILTAQATGGSVREAKPVLVTVRSGVFTRVIVRVDSGIR